MSVSLGLHPLGSLQTVMRAAAPHKEHLLLIYRRNTHRPTEISTWDLCEPSRRPSWRGAGHSRPLTPPDTGALKSFSKANERLRNCCMSRSTEVNRGQPRSTEVNRGPLVCKRATQKLRALRWGKLGVSKRWRRKKCIFMIKQNKQIDNSVVLCFLGLRERAQQASWKASVRGNTREIRRVKNFHFCISARRSTWTRGTGPRRHRREPPQIHVTCTDFTCRRKGIFASDPLRVSGAHHFEDLDFFQ